MFDSLINWTLSTGLGDTIHALTWAFPIGEALHFMGLSLLVGTVGMFDLRMLGVAKMLPAAPLHKLINWGIAGFCVNLTTGIMFWFVQPAYYVHDQPYPVTLKLIFLALAGINVLVFRTTVYREVLALGPGEDAPTPAKVIGGVSLFFWAMVIFWGRMIMYT